MLRLVLASAALLVVTTGCQRSRERMGRLAVSPSPPAPHLERHPLPTIETVQVRADINRMDVQDFMVIGFPRDLAMRIVRYRQANGPFHNVDELRTIPGVSEQFLDSVRERIAAGPPAESAGIAPSPRMRIEGSP